MGLPHPAENGFAWHPVLGVPYLCGAAVKGLLRAWVEQWAGLDDDARDERVERWFGKAPRGAGDAAAAGNDSDAGDEASTSGHAGHLLFFDALPITPPTIVADVMTPHLGKWYESGDEILDATDATGASEGSASRIPGDWHSPNPVSFLVVEQATFLFTIAARTEVGVDEVEPAMAALEKALDQLGAGAKTAAGYGQMEKDNRALANLKKQEANHRNARARAEEEARKAAEAKAETDRTAAERDALPAFERSLHVMADEAELGSMQGYLALIKVLEDGTWNGDEARRAAVFTQSLMAKEKAWRPVSQKRKPAKDTEHQATLKVLRWLENEDP